MKRSPAAATALLMLAGAAGAAAGEPAQTPEVSGALAYVDSDRLDLVGILSARVPFVTRGAWSVLVGARAVTAIRRTDAELTFLVEQLDYALDLDARRDLGADGSVFFGLAERGATRVDAAGRAKVRLLEASWESRGYGSGFGPAGWSGRVEAGAIVEHEGLSVFASARGGLRWLHPMGRVLVGFDADADALIGTDGGTDLLAGGRVDFDLGGDRRVALFARWLRGRNPLGLGTDGLVLGFDVAQGRHAPADRPMPPDVSGLAAAGAGGGDALARLLVRVATPPFWDGTFVRAEIDANALTATEAAELFYLYDVGIAHPFGRTVAGAWYYHRSNHQLDHANPEVRSFNVIELGIETPDYGKAEPGLPLGRAGGLDARLHAGWLASSSFGEDASWQARAGLRWSTPDLVPDLRLYAAVELERGDVGRRVAAVGATFPRGWDVRVESRDEQQLFDSDKRRLLCVATLYF